MFKIQRVGFLFLYICLSFLTHCGELFPVPLDPTDEEPTPSGPTTSIGGQPSSHSLSIYQTSNLGELCVFSDCQTDIQPLPASHKTIYQDRQKTCAFDYDPNQSSQLLIRQRITATSGLKLHFSKEDLFFLAWASMRYQINPHFLMAIMAQESAGNCAAVSYADAEGCFQITNYYGRLQLQQSFANRVLNWHWNENPDGYYDSNLFINQTTWFGEVPVSEQNRMTLDPASAQVLGTSVSSVVNFHYGVIASALYFHWEQYFLHHNYSSTQDLVGSLIHDDENQKAGLMAAAYNGGISALAQSLKSKGENYLQDMSFETEDYFERVLNYCVDFQDGSNLQQATYHWDEVEYLLDLLAMTYDPELEIDWDQLKDHLKDDFFSDTKQLNFIDDGKALIYYISTFDPALAPVWPDDVLSP